MIVQKTHQKIISKVLSVPVNEPLLTEHEKNNLLECIDTGWISSEGPFIAQFEHMCAQQAEKKYGVAVVNGSVALEVAVKALGIGEHDEVIMPTFTIISCAAALIRAGATPVLVDSNADTFNMNVDQIEQKITSRTKAIMVVHLYGLPVDMDPIMLLAKKYHLKIIEDVAEAQGQTYKGKPCGSFGDVACLSFYPNKFVTTGEGGMVLATDEAVTERCRSLRNLCFKPGRRFVHDELGHNYRITNLQAAVGVAQMQRLESHVTKKRFIGDYYTAHLSDIDHLQLPLQRTAYAYNNYWVYGVVVKPSSPYSADDLVQKLAEQGIATRPFFWCMHEQPVFARMGLFRGEQYPVAENLARHGFYIPSGLGITQEQMDRVVEVIKTIFYVKNKS